MNVKNTCFFYYNKIYTKKRYDLFEEFLKHNKELSYSDEINENADYITRGMFNWKEGETEDFYKNNFERIVNKLNVKSDVK